MKKGDASKPAGKAAGKASKVAEMVRRKRLAN